MTPPSSNGKDTTLSRWRQGFDSPWGHAGSQGTTDDIGNIGAVAQCFAFRGFAAKRAQKGSRLRRDRRELHGLSSKKKSYKLGP